MGNALILVLIATFGVVWVSWAHRWAWTVVSAFFKRPKLTLQAAWIWGVTLISSGLLIGFALMAMALPPLLQALFSESAEVSVSMIALAIVVALAISWLISLNRYRILAEDSFEESEVKAKT